MKVTVVAKFCASHLLPGHPVCGSTHGHNYKVRAVIDGEPNDGMVVDFGRVKETLRQFDHKHLNDADVENEDIHIQAVRVNPTAENLVQCFAEKIRELGSFNTIQVRVWETDDCSVTTKILGVHQGV